MTLPSELRTRFARIASPACFAATASRGRWRLVPHLDAIDRAILDTIRQRSAPILVIEAPPRHGKSELISRYLPAWFLGTFPEKRVMLAAYGAAFARSWGRKARELLEEFGPEFFGVTVRGDLHSASEWGLAGHEGGMVASGVGGPMTGRGADLLIIDDPIKNSGQSQSETIRESHWDWWQSTASTRIEPGGCTIIIATRWHEDDLSGRLIKAAREGEGGAVRELRLPALAEEDDPLRRPEGAALWPDRWSARMLDARRRSVSPGWWLAQYQQRPGRGDTVSWGDDYFGPDLWAAAWPDVFERSVLTLDPAGGNSNGDYAAIVFVGYSGGLLWVDARLERQAVEQSVARAIALAEVWRPHLVGYESNQFQYLVGTEFDRQCRDAGRPPLPLVPILNTIKKRCRILNIGPYLAGHKLRFRDHEGGRLLVRQLREHPLATHDDGPDALEMALRLIQLPDMWNGETAGDVFEIARA
jgi:hypothetical protein